MLVHKLEENLWVVRQGEEIPAPFCFDSREAASRALELPMERRQVLQQAADDRAGGSGVITLNDVLLSIAAWRN